jgi:hypothetical protein
MEHAQVDLTALAETFKRMFETSKYSKQKNHRYFESNLRLANGACTS